MAFVGLKMPVFAPIAGYDEETHRPTYGTGFIIGMAIKADVTINYAEATLYADDILAESDSSFQNGTVDVGVDEISHESDTKLFGHEESADNSGRSYQSAEARHFPALAADCLSGTSECKSVDWSGSGNNFILFDEQIRQA